MNVNEIEHGWDVYGADGQKVGDVSDVQETYIAVSRGLIFKSERYIPVPAIARVEHDRVYLDVTKDEIEARGWDRVPEAGGVAEERPERMPEPTGRTEQDAAPRGADRPERREDVETVELREDELHTRKQMVKTGEVEIRKEVVTEMRTVEVPVTREELVIERRPAGQSPDRPAGEGETIRVPLREEQVTIEKRPVVYEEVEVSKREVEDTELVSREVRREVADVEARGDVEVRGWDEARGAYRQEWERRSGAAGGRWEDVEPGYRYGHELSGDPRYRERGWEEVEPDVRAGFGDWSRRQGYRGAGDDDSAWERLKESVREAWEESRRTDERR